MREESTKQRQSSGTTRLHEKTRDKLRKRAAAADSGFRLTRGGALRTENDTETASSGVSHRHASGTDAFTLSATFTPFHCATLFQWQAHGRGQRSDPNSDSDVVRLKHKLRMRVKELL